MLVRNIRSLLEKIPGAFLDFPPEDVGGAGEPGVVYSAIHDPELSHLASPKIWQESFGDDATEEGWDSSSELECTPVVELGSDADIKMARLAGAAEERIRRSVEVDAGPDALGYYVSFHQRGIQWGITLRVSGVAWLAERYFKELPVDLETRLRLAFFAILQHELFHFATDVAVSQAEISQQVPLWVWAKSWRHSSGQRYSHREEKLANAWMLKQFRTASPAYRAQGKQAALRRFVNSQPPGYRDAPALRSSEWHGELHALICDVINDAEGGDNNPLILEKGYRWEAQFPLVPNIPWQECVIRLADDSERFGVPSGWLNFLLTIPEIATTPKFLKRLARMGPDVKKRWDVLQRSATAPISPGLNFKPWPPGPPVTYSVRLGDNARLHVRHDRQNGRWIAEDIGMHSDMGHG